MASMEKWKEGCGEYKIIGGNDEKDKEKQLLNKGKKKIYWEKDV